MAKSEHLIIFQKVYEMIREIYRDCNNFPKSQKFVLGQRIENTMVNILENIISANSAQNKQPHLIPTPVAKAVGAPLALPAGRQVGAQNTKPKEITLAIRAQEDSFITLKVDGKIVYQRMMYKGKAETWSAKTKIELSVGNAGGLSLEVNGKPILPLGKKGQQIKNILINSDGLKVL